MFVESLLWYVVVPKGFFGVGSAFSAALYIPSGFSDSRFETTPDLALLESVKTTMAKSH
ncbi:hypothetical protein [Vibrio owensii]|uniref:hypothetical protein n=1 Tax=Vibrio owensii TaxID=696485 RepID=UPI003D9FCEDC